MMRILLSLLLAIVVASPSRGGESVKSSKGLVVQSKGPATLEIRYDGDRQHITLADVITTELRVEGSKDLQVDIPAGYPTGWNFLKPIERATKEPIDKDRVRWRMIARFAPDQPGPK